MCAEEQTLETPNVSSVLKKAVMQRLSNNCMDSCDYFIPRERKTVFESTEDITTPLKHLHKKEV